VAESFRALALKVHDALGDLSWAFLSIKPSPARWDLIDRIRLTNRAVKEAMTHVGNGSYVDVFPPMLTPAGRPRPELFLPDGLHLSPAGYRLWRDILL
jgi:lysophospholipase L1-like esterase